LKPRLTQAEAEIQIEATSDTVKVLIESLQPELEHAVSERSTVNITFNNKGIVIGITADDVTALRAAVNSYLYWVRGILDIGNRIND
jgi:tRNA threonylcarbamoyladenosine modification (KEOPS) complex  Pcc1 subunit